MDRTKRTRFIPWQFSLRTMLVVGIAAGTWAGLFGPKLVQTIHQWTTPPPTPSLTITHAVRYLNEHHDGYYESAETPLH